jgi:SAM-dependent methyltransferase
MPPTEGSKDPARWESLAGRSQSKLLSRRVTPAVPFSFPGIAADVRRLRDLLALGLRAAEWMPPEKVAVLNLACGRADETGVLLGAVAPRAAELFYLGIDLRPPEIAEAKSRWIPSAPPGWQLDFRAGDASRTDRMKQLPPFDFVFIRHQNYWHDAAVWEVLYRNALDGLRPGGLLAITSYFDREHELAMACLSQCGGRKLADLRNPHSRPLDDAPNKSVDRRLAVFSR